VYTLHTLDKRKQVAIALESECSGGAEPCIIKISTEVSVLRHSHSANVKRMGGPHSASKGVAGSCFPPNDMYQTTVTVFPVVPSSPSGV